ncbi:MAG: lipoprotein-releasing ABC transporter permease subunit [Alphaproteobacteria bacterium]|nr:MAG: lipoprotein-releasing ABC transporter permease subunit [Alphaproteobacteria bacterium]
MSTNVKATKPFSRFEWMIAGRYLRSRRKEGFISVIAVLSFVGIMLGVGVLITVMAVMNGFRTELIGKILGFRGHITIQAEASNELLDYNALADLVRPVKGVQSVTPVIEGQVMAQGRGTMTGALLRGITLEDLNTLGTLGTPATQYKGIKYGNINRFGEKDTVMIGARMANNLDLRPGDKITLIAPNGPRTAFGTVPRRKAYTIIAFFEIGMVEYDSSVVFMPLDQAQGFFSMPEAVSNLEVMVEDPDEVEYVKPALAQALGQPVRMYDWKETNKTFVSALIVERNVMFMILTLIVLIAALNIISGLIMLVKDKGKGIAIMRTMGATQGSVMRIFFIAGASIGVTGTLTGFALGLLACNYIEEIRQFIMWVTQTEIFDPEIYFLSRMVADVDSGETTAVLVMGLSLSVLATLYPSWRAARLDPVEALRYE